MIARVLAIASACLLSASWATATEPVAASAPRSLTAIRLDVSDALRKEAKTRRTGNNTPEVLRLVNLYLEMASHPKRDDSPLLNDLGQQVHLRLQTVRDRIDRKITEKIPSAKRTAKPSSATAKPENRVLAQQLPPPQAARGGLNLAVTGTQSVPAGATDFGPELVELIEAVISPATWRINGGTSAIVYYSPLHVLVVSAPDEVHAQVAGVLRQLQAAQRRHDGAQVVADVGLARANN
jgi:hypothetical protein